MDSTVPSTLIDLGTLGIFIFFVVKMYQMMQDHEKRREDRWASAFEKTTSDWCATLDKYAASLDKYTESLDKLARQVAYNTSMVINHDAWSRGKLGNGKSSDVKEIASILMTDEDGIQK